ncbi:class I SAM-dependent methyltransferase [Parvularcula sp. ZS-1/3]|uniref:Ubiquinone/menaquinone biosynthesis C-methyltransferase UbiE n=1 Tax=Parvularcula mediterranea TaxID=2732508 RepID=A0A7Y3RKQ7_9PROT|nr:class I SAM-dependent methyltransferase [Parvularcula mediterranea]NNU15841.1 class I SAM-dependent methyltransferase [Parvularcula mediterranea]
MSEEKTVPFGARDVSREEKAPLVREVFRSVATSYDVMNDFMSGGMHRVWKSVTVDRMNPQPGHHLIDVAGGTGDIAASFLTRAGERDPRGRAPAEAVVCDINHAMLDAGNGRDHAARVCGDAEKLPFTDGMFSHYSIGFGIRNVTDRAAAFREAFRVLRFGGRLFVLEFSQPPTEGFRAVYDRYSDEVIPRLGEAVAGDRESYQYLVDSIRRFPGPDDLASEIRAAGFSRVKYERFTGGICVLHMAAKI